MISQDLIKTARELTKISRRRPTQANLRRAVSTAYYAVFHCLARVAADLLIGGSQDEAWHQVYRALQHGDAGKACQNKQAMQGFDNEIQDFAETFVALQEARNQADYALDGRYGKLDVLATIDRAEKAIEGFERADRQQRRTFVAHVLFIKRRRLQGASR